MKDSDWCGLLNRKLLVNGVYAIDNSLGDDRFCGAAKRPVEFLLVLFAEFNVLCVLPGVKLLRIGESMVIGRI